ncbi:MAG: hypothetical protein JW932_20265 [Deltaproteobacteria bacterium]|nr:hypothetical protein [Deltaproteobacteria bacterium]
MPIEESNIPDSAFDMHTDEGIEEMKRGLGHFFNGAASVKNERFPDDLEEQGKEAHYQVQRERLSEGQVIERIWEKCSDHGGQMKLPF